MTNVREVMDEDKKTLRDRYNTVTSSIAMVNSAIGMGRNLKSKYNQKFLYTASLDEDSFIYGDMLKYINAKTNTRNFKFYASREGVVRLYDSESSVTFYIDDHKIKASLSKPKFSSFDDDDDYNDSDMGLRIMSSAKKKEELWFTCSSPEDLNALEALLVQMTNKRQEGRKVNYVGSTDVWGNWDYENLPYKNIDSVFLPNGEKEDLIYDIEKFQRAEERFKTVGIPYHRGYCFYGEPGNGKSSIALALANHFGMDLYNLPLSVIKEDKGLTRAVNGLRQNSILLLEDVDVFSNSVSRDGTVDVNNVTPSLAGLLNALDGVTTPHGMITIMTTNHVDRLDPALIRPGRMDYKMELKAPVASQIEGMFLRVFDEHLGIEPNTYPSMAAVADVFKRNIDDAEAVRLELKND